MKTFRSLTHLILAAVFLSGCTRFIGTPPPPASTQTPLPAEPTTAQTLPQQPTATGFVLPPEDRRATVSEIVNIVEAKVFAEAVFKSVTDGAVIGTGGQVRTGANSRARIDLSAGTVVRLASDTVFTLEALTDSGGDPFALVRIELGKIWVNLSGGALQVVTPVGSASVRGSFAIFQYFPGSPDDPSDDSLILDCIEGHCDLQSGSISEQAGNLERIVLSNGGQQIVHLTLTDGDVQNFILNNPDVGEAIVATLTAAPPPQTAAPAPTGTSAPAAQVTPTSTVAAPPPAPVPIIGRHLLIGGETLFCIGRAYGVLPGAIAEANGLDSDTFVYPGQVLIIPAVQWVNIPDGPVCNPQFDSPYPGLPPTTPVPTGESANGGAPTATPAPTDTPQPNCQPPEFFDPFLNRCRLPDQPVVDQPADTSPPTISSASASASRIDTSTCTVTFVADITDNVGVASANASWTVVGGGSSGSAMSLVSGSTWQAVTAIAIPSGGSLAWSVNATDDAKNSSNLTGNTVSCR